MLASFYRCLAVFCLALSALPCAQAQEPEIEIPPDLGFLRIVNAAGRPGKLWVTVNGVKLAAASGYEDGAATGAMGLTEKSLSIEMRHEDIGELKLPVTLKAGIVTTLIAFVESKPPEESKNGGAQDEGEAKIKLAAHLLELPASRQGEKSTLSLIQFTPAAQLPLSVASTSCVLEPKKPQTISITPDMGTFLDVKLQGKIVAQLNFMDPAGQGVVLFTDTAGVLKSAQFRNDVQ